MPTAGVERWSEAFNSGDVEQIVRMYTNDALVLGTLSPGMTSKPDDLRAYFKASAAAKLQVKLGDHSTVALAEDAVAIAGFYDFSRPAADGQPAVVLHALVSSWSKKTAFGRSLITILGAAEIGSIKRVGKRKKRPFRITFAGIAGIRWLRRLATPDSCDWWNEPFPKLAA
jgi:hypothetical protein